MYFIDYLKIALEARIMAETPVLRDGEALIRLAEAIESRNFGEYLAAVREVRNFDGLADEIVWRIQKRWRVDEYSYAGVAY